MNILVSHFYYFLYIEVYNILNNIKLIIKIYIKKIGDFYG